MKTLISMLTAAVLLSSGVAMAEVAKPATTPAAKPAVTAPAKTAVITPAKTKHTHIAGVRSEKSLKCSADADAKSLHGKERKMFRHACMKAA